MSCRQKRPLEQVYGVSASSVRTLAKVCMKLDTYTEEQRPRTARCSADPGEDVQTASRWTAGGGATAHAHTLTGGTEPDGGLGHGRAGTAGQQGRQRAGVRTTGPALGTGESRAPSSPAHADRPQGGGRTPRLLRGGAAHGGGDFAATLGRRCPSGGDG